MKHLILYLLLLSSFTGFSQHPVKRSKLKGGFVSGPVGIVEWNPVTAIEPTYASVTDGQYIWHNSQSVGLRTAFHYTPLGYSIPTLGGKKRFQCWVNPRTDAVGSNYNYRDEFSQDWETGFPLGTRDVLAFGIVLQAGALKARTHDIDFNQWHSGSFPGEPSNDPAIFSCFSPAGVEDDNDDVSQLNEVVIVNKIRDFEQSGDPNISGRINTGIVVANGERHDFVYDITAGINGTGNVTIWHCSETSPGVFSDWTVIYQATESTAWANGTDGGSNPNVLPDWKLGLYIPALRTLGGVTAAEDLNGGVGTYSATINFVGVRNIYVPTTHAFYNRSLLGYIQTTDMP